MWPYVFGDEVGKAIYSIENPFSLSVQDLSKFSHQIKVADYILNIEVQFKGELKKNKIEIKAKFIEPILKRSLSSSSNGNLMKIPRKSTNESDPKSNDSHKSSDLKSNSHRSSDHHYHRSSDHHHHLSTDRNHHKSNDHHYLKSTDRDHQSSNYHKSSQKSINDHRFDENMSSNRSKYPKFESTYNVLSNLHKDKNSSSWNHQSHQITAKKTSNFLSNRNNLPNKNSSTSDDSRKLKQTINIDSSQTASPHMFGFKNYDIRATSSNLPKNFKTSILTYNPNSASDNLIPIPTYSPTPSTTVNQIPMPTYSPTPSAFNQFAIPTYSPILSSPVNQIPTFSPILTSPVNQIPMPTYSPTPPSAVNQIPTTYDFNSSSIYNLNASSIYNAQQSPNIIISVNDPRSMNNQTRNVVNNLDPRSRTPNTAQTKDPRMINNYSRTPPIATNQTANRRDTNQREVNDTNRREVNDTNRREVNNTNRREVNSTNRSEMNSTSRRESNSTSRSEVNSTSRRESNSTSRREVSNTNRRESNSTNRREVSNTSRRESNSTNRREAHTNDLNRSSQNRREMNTIDLNSNDINRRNLNTSDSNRSDLNVNKQTEPQSTDADEQTTKSNFKILSIKEYKKIDTDDRPTPGGYEAIDLLLNSYESKSKDKKINSDHLANNLNSNRSNETERLVDTVDDQIMSLDIDERINTVDHNNDQNMNATNNSSNEKPTVDFSPNVDHSYSLPLNGRSFMECDQIVNLNDKMINKEIDEEIIKLSEENYNDEGEAIENEMRMMLEG